MLDPIRAQLCRVCSASAGGWLALAAVAATLIAAPASAEAPEDIDQLRQRALELVNAARQQHGLSPLQLGEALNDAAQRHADDMFKRNYYSHNSPEGNDVQDRYIAAGGSRWRLVAENIARCAGCRPPATTGTVEQLQQGWMNSPHHRENILREGLDRFGYGLVDDGEQGLYGVQTFAGAGTPRGSSPDDKPQVLAEDQVLPRMTDLINRARKAKGAGPLQPSRALTEVATAMMPPESSDGIELKDGDAFQNLPADQRRSFRSIGVIAEACGGCGAEATAADLRAFRRQWLDNPQYQQRLLDPELTYLGFALQVDGRGRKVALAVLGKHR
ncbi:hypothetical protein DNX69_19105 [Rhodopseudomonas palustris]|uniref:SCP domain-containing protein n=1 Tax=Rhodopseudomonas palustris TaxID=1076 RepID=A0A323UEQ5_RHOPL|nr:CAP domain-containing protein [Rhodopseudomonas palustris]PZA11392.1 hypothetical protein DNX69_19105 [Rhodopseudomonas palustris]